jgi:hypothetical protein
MALSDCVDCWSTPCECYNFKNSSIEYKERMTKSINGHTIREVFQWLGKMDYLSDDEEILYGEFINRNCGNSK